MKIFACTETLDTAYTSVAFATFFPDTFRSVEFLTRFYSKYIPVALLEWISPWRDDVVSRERNYRCHECTRARQLLPSTLRPVTATTMASFSISRPRNSKATVIIRKAACRSQKGTRGARHANPGAVPMQESVATSSVISFAIKRLWSLPRR